jgi:hypothetical protein
MCRLAQSRQLREYCHFRYWPKADMAGFAGNVRYRVMSGKHLLDGSISGFDPKRTWPVLPMPPLNG